METKQYIYIVQVTRQLSVDIVNAFVRNGSSVELLTGVVEYNYQELDDRVKVRLYNKYNNSSFFKRTISGLLFTLRCFFYILFKSGKKELILVSTPPFVFYLGWFFNKIRKQKFHLIIWDLYPDVIVNFSVLKKDSFIISLWRRLNKITFKKAENIFTLGKHLSDAIIPYGGPTPVIIPNWVDTSFILPVEKNVNSFIAKHNLAGKFIVLYSGNLGLTHDVESIVYAANELKDNRNIQFVIIGEGHKKSMIESYVKQNSLSNVLILPYQDKSVLPFSLTSADISIVTLSKGAESISVPSKTYYSLSAGSAIFALASKESELGLLIEKYDCGKVFDNFTSKQLAESILDLASDINLLNQYKLNSRKAAAFFTPENASKYVGIITKGN